MIHGLRGPALAIVLALVAVRPLATSQRAAQASTAESAVHFVNVAGSSGIDFVHTNGASADHYLPEIMGSGVVFLDYDNDGWIDIFLVDGGSFADRSVDGRARHRLYHNRGNGTFEDVTMTSGIAHTHYGLGACAADYDNDGWIDLFITGAGANSLYHNNQGKSFTDVTRTAGVARSTFGTSCAFADVDRDGFADLFVTNYVDARTDNNVFCGEPRGNVRTYCHPLNFKPLAPVLYHNNGNGTFVDVSAATGIAAARGNGLGVVVGDYDDDGWPDIFVANDSTPNFLFHNEGHGLFKEVGLIAGVALASDGNRRAGMGTDFGDYDGDGRVDLFVTNHELEMHTLHRNLGHGLFADVTSESGVGLLTLPFVGFGTVFFDVDNDGDLDLAIADGHVLDNSGHFRAGAKDAQRNLLLRNDSGRFKEIGQSAGPGFAIEKVSRGLAAADIDNDGDLDLLVTNNGAAADLLRNDAASTNNAVILRLVGTRSNRSAIGARVRLTAAGATQMREVKAGSGYLSQNDLRLHFGLGRAAAIEQIEIRWPSGAVETIRNLSINQIATITEGKGVTGKKAFAKK